MAIAPRALNYRFFNLARLEMLRLVVELDLVTEELAGKIPHEVWRGVMDQVLKCPRCMERMAEKVGLEPDK